MPGGEDMGTTQTPAQVIENASGNETTTELSTLSHSHLYNHEQQSLRFVEHSYNFNIANKTCA